MPKQPKINYPSNCSSAGKKITFLIELQEEVILDFNSSKLDRYDATVLLHKRLSVISKEKHNAQREAVRQKLWKPSEAENIKINENGFNVENPENLYGINISGRLNFIHELIEVVGENKLPENPTLEQSDIHHYTAMVVGFELENIEKEALKSSTWRQRATLPPILTMFEGID